MTALLLLLAPALAMPGPADVRARLERMRSAADALREYTYTFQRQEWVDGKQQPQHLMSIKFRKPMEIYIHWIGDTYKGRELLYKRGWNDGNMMVKPGPMLPTLSLDPNGRIAKRGSRHGIEMIDLSNVAKLILSQTDRLEASATLSATFSDGGAQVINGEPSWCTSIGLPKDKDPALYAYRVDMCLSEASGLLTRLRSWDMDDGQLRQVADYEFRQVNLSPGLTDSDFDNDNPAYNF